MLDDPFTLKNSNTYLHDFGWTELAAHVTMILYKLPINFDEIHAFNTLLTLSFGASAGGG
jgi:hypothetical protein